MKKRYSLVFLGTDGSGKSTIIESVCPLLKERYGYDIRYEHLRPNYIPSIAVLLGKRSKEEEDNERTVSNPHQSKQSGRIGSLFRFIYYLFDYTIGYYCKVCRSSKSIWAFDRYYYEFYFDQKRSRTNLPSWIIRFGEHIIPKPDLIICLGGNPEKIYARKPETSLEEVRRQTKVLNEFCHSRRNTVWVDTTVAPEESICNAMSAICGMINKCFVDIEPK